MFRHLRSIDRQTKDLIAEREIVERFVSSSAANIVLVIVMSTLGRGIDLERPATIIAPALISVTSLIRFILSARIKNPNVELDRDAFRWLEAVTLFAGLLWGIFVAVSLTEDPDLDFYDIVTVIGICMITVTSCTQLSAKPGLARAFAASALLPSILSLAVSEGDHFRALACLLAAFLFFLWTQIAIQYRQFDYARRAMWQINRLNQYDPEEVPKSERRSS